MRHLSVLVLVAIMALVAPIAGLAAQEATPAAGDIFLAPDAMVDGSDLAEWYARYWQWSLSLSTPVNPASDATGANCGLGQQGPVFFLAMAPASVERVCTVPTGAVLFVPLGGAECSTVESPPWFGGDEAELRACANSAVDGAEREFDMSIQAVSVDGQTTGDLTPYRVVTPLFSVVLPADNDLGVPAGPAQAVGDGYAVMVAPLPEGEHVLVATIPGPVPVVITYQLTVASGALVPATTPDPNPAATPASSLSVVDSSVDAGDGHSLHLACAGEGSPTVLFEPGGPFFDGGTSIVYALGPDLAAALGTRFCAYDRAGTGQSDPHPMAVRTFDEAADDLLTVLASPELACPCVVIGESLGGSISLVALTEDASGFAGLVLLDAPYPGSLDRLLELAPPDAPEIGPEFQTYNGGENEEGLDVLTGFGQVAVPAQPPTIPIVVVTHGAGYPPPCSWEPPCSPTFPVEDFEASWQAGQQALATSLGARLIVAEDTGHAIADENPELVIMLVAEVIAAVGA